MKSEKALKMLHTTSPSLMLLASLDAARANLQSKAGQAMLDRTIENAKYNVKDAEISCEYQYGISNEVLPGKVAKVNVKEGRLLLVKVSKYEMF